MRQPKTLKYLFDIAEGCRLLDQFTSGKTHADYAVDGYAGVLSDVVWGILETHVPTLRSEVARLLEGQAE